MRRAARVDANQREIAAALRQMGCSVTHLHQVGGGVPDLMVGFQNRTYLLEIKNLDGRGSVLTPEQVEWFLGWCGGPVSVVHDVDEAIAVVCAK